MKREYEYIEGEKARKNFNEGYNQLPLRLILGSLDVAVDHIEPSGAQPALKREFEGHTPHYAVPLYSTI